MIKKISISTPSKSAIVPITDRIEQVIHQSGAVEGVCHIFVAHTTSAVTTADLDPGTDLDFIDFLRKITPRIAYRHPHDPAHAPDHILASIIGCSLSVPFQSGKLLLGTWQEVVLVELDGPRERNVSVTIS